MQSKAFLERPVFPPHKAKGWKNRPPGDCKLIRADNASGREVIVLKYNNTQSNGIESKHFLPFATSKCYFGPPNISNLLILSAFRFKVEN